jgi:hypothetical protein
VINRNVYHYHDLDILKKFGVYLIRTRGMFLLPASTVLLHIVHTFKLNKNSCDYSDSTLTCCPATVFLFPFLYFHIKPAIVCCFSIPFPRTIFHYMFIPEIDNNRGLQNWNRRNKDFRLCHGIAFITDESSNNKQEYFN